MEPNSGGDSATTVNSTDAASIDSVTSVATNADCYFAVASTAGGQSNRQCLEKASLLALKSKLSDWRSAS